MKSTMKKLKNQLNTLFIDAPGSTSASVQIWFQAGSALEKDGDHGIAHFLEHMFFKGTKKRPGSKIAFDVESFGGEINAFTSFDYTCYYINTPINHLQETTHILMDMVSNPEFKEEELIPERGVVFEEFRRSIDNPNQYGFGKLQSAIFTKGYQHQILGNEKSILSFDRNQLMNFRDAHYNITNSLLVVAGDLKHQAEIEKIIESYTLAQGPKSEFPDFTLKATESCEVHSKEVRMCALHLCIQAPEFESLDAAVEDLAVNSLGHGETSRLYRSLVIESGLCNHVSGSTMFMNKGGAHFIKLSFPFENIDKVLTEFKKVIIEACRQGLHKDEVQKIKNQYVASKVYDLESIESFAFSLGHSYAQTGNVKAEEEFIHRIKRVTVDQINQSLPKLFGKNVHISLQIPKGESEKSSAEKCKKFQKELKTSLKSMKSKTQDRLTFKIDKSKYDEQVRVVTLKNGVKLLHRYNPMAPTFVMQAYIRGGLTDETKKTSGLYHQLTACFNKGYAKMNYQKLKQDLENKSASFTSFAGKNAHGLNMHGQTEHFDELATHFCGTLLTPSFPQKHITLEKKLTLRSIEAQKEDPVRCCFKKVSEVFFKDHPYSLSLLGEESVIKKITRKNIQDLHAKNLKNSPILISYCGEQSLEEVLGVLTPLLAPLKPRAEKKIVFKKIKSATGEEHKIFFDREQTQIFYGIPCGNITAKDHVALKMLTAHLSGQSSELFVDVRDRKGLCYTAQPVHFSALEGGYWGIYMASGHDKVEAACEAIESLLARISNGGISKVEFERIKVMIEGQNLINVQTNEDFANIYSVPVLQGQGLDYYHETNKKVHELTYEKFQAEISRVLKKKFSTIIVGR